MDFDHQGFRDDRTSFGRGHALWRTAKIDGDRKTLKRGTFSNVIKGPEAGPSDGQQTI